MTNISIHSLLPRQIRELPADIALALGAVIVIDIGIGTCVVLDLQILQFLLAVPLVLVIPGYVFVAALFPEQNDTQREVTADETSSISGFVRSTLSIATSFMLFALIVFVLDASPLLLSPVRIIAALTFVVVSLAFVAAHRRSSLPAETRLEVPIRTWIANVISTLHKRDTGIDRVLNVILILAVLFAVVSVTYALTVPRKGDHFTEFYLLGPDGKLPSGNVSRKPTANQSDVIVGLRNHEYERMEYTIVVAWTQNRTASSNHVLRTFSTPPLAHNQSWQTSYSLPRLQTQSRTKVNFLLYRGDRPATVTTETAYRRTHVWITPSK